MRMGKNNTTFGKKQQQSPLHKTKVLSMRLGINVLPGGRQAREGGNSKNKTTARSP